MAIRKQFSTDREPKGPYMRAAQWTMLLLLTAGSVGCCSLCDRWRERYCNTPQTAGAAPAACPCAPQCCPAPGQSGYIPPTAVPNTGGYANPNPAPAH
jgi:hypothetical protein